MIFKKFLQPKWKSSDPLIRLKAVKELTGELEKNRTIIEALAFKDNSHRVRQLALETLNDFTLWWQASNNETSERLKKTAEDQVLKALIGDPHLLIDDQQKQQFIEQCNKVTLLEELALQDKSEQLRLELLLKLNKPALFNSVIQDSHSSEQLKGQIIDHIDDLAQLEKWLKKSDGEIRQKLADKIMGIKSALEKPLQLKREVALMLAKLNALKDKHDIEDIEQRQQILTAQWQGFQKEFSLLTEAETAEFNDKFNKISQSLHNIIAPLRERWEAEQAELVDAQQKQDNAAQIAARLAQVEAMLTNAIGEHTELEKEYFAAPLQAIRQQMQSLNLTTDDKNGFVCQIEQFYSKIEQIPLISDCMAEATRLISTMSSVALPQSTEQLSLVYDDYLAWQKKWRDNQKRIGLAFPESITSAYRSLSEQWSAAVKPLLQEQHQLSNQVRKALTDLKHQLAAGKYRRAFGLYRKLSYLIEQLTPSQLSKVARDFDNVKRRVEELADWQEYIATPRKQQLLEEITELGENPAAHPDEQAQKVKFIRQMWNSLGRAVDDADQALNEQFNQASEKAFEICRQYYAEKEAMRLANYEAKQAICAQLSEASKLLQGDDTPWQEVESTVSRIRREWKAVGEVDRDKMAALNEYFYSLLDPLQKALRQYHDQNAELKQKLVNVATDLLAADDVFDATNQLKTLQQQWRQIGFAGAKIDNKIWRKFREVNDQLFAKRDSVKSQRNEEQLQKVNSIEQQLEQIEDVVLNTDDVGLLNKSSAQISELLATLDSEPKSIQNKINIEASKLSGLIKTRKQELVLAANREHYVSLFAQFQHLSCNGELDDNIQTSAPWHSILSGLAESGDPHLRYDLTLQLEIIHGVESPVKDTDRRMELQMALLSNKLNEGELARHDDLLKDWVAIGRLQPDEQELLDRVMALYL